MECDFHRTSYMKIIFEDLKSTRARAPRSLEAARKYSGDIFQDEELEHDSRITRKPAVFGYETLGGLSEIDLWVPTRKLSVKKEVVHLQNRIYL